MPQFKTQSFETAIVERCQRLESSLDKPLIEIYRAGVWLRRVKDIAQPWGTCVSLETVNDLNEKISAKIDAGPLRKTEGTPPCVLFDGIATERRWARGRPEMLRS